MALISNKTIILIIPALTKTAVRLVFENWWFVARAAIGINS